MIQKAIVAIGALAFMVVVSSSLSGITILTNAKSCAVVLGGTILCAALSYPLKTFRDLSGSLKLLWESKLPDYAGLIRQIENLARIRRMSGPRDLDAEANRADNVFLSKGIALIADGYNRHDILCIMEKEYEFYFSAKDAQVNLLNTLARFAPAFGFVGTIIGLINILNHMKEPELIGPGMAMALLTTLYGLIFANLFALPLARKLSEKNRSEALFLNVVLEGVLDIADAKNAVSIGYRLRSLLGLHVDTHPAGSRNMHARETVSRADHILRNRRGGGNA